MNRAKIFIMFTFLLAFAICVSAQNESPKIVWGNLQEIYENIYDIKPFIKVEGIKPIYLISSFYSAGVFRYDEQTQKWEKRLQPYICGYAAARIKPFRLNSNKKMVINFFDGAFLSSNPFMPPLEKSSQVMRKGKYTFQLYYGLNNSDINIVSESPIFEVTEYKPE